MAIHYARIRFDDEPTKYVIEHISNIKTIENDDEENCIAPENDMDFDARHTYYCKYVICKESCVQNHQHYDYYPCRIFLLGGNYDIF